MSGNHQIINNRECEWRAVRVRCSHVGCALSLPPGQGGCPDDTDSSKTVPAPASVCSTENQPDQIVSAAAKKVGHLNAWRKKGGRDTRIRLPVRDVRGAAVAIAGGKNAESRADAWSHMIYPGGQPSEPDGSCSRLQPQAQINHIFACIERPSLDSPKISPPTPASKQFPSVFLACWTATSHSNPANI